jgi:hypothetical protein
MTTSYEKNKEKRLAYQQAYAQEHKEAIAVYRAAYYQRVTKLKRQKTPLPGSPTPPIVTPTVFPQESVMVSWD